MVFQADSHVHTSFSDDSRCPMEVMVQQAYLLGLDEITCTEHVDYGVKTDLNCPYDAYFATIHALQQRYHGQIKIRAGIEFGVQVHTIPLYEHDAKMYDFDFILLSNHQIQNLEFWNQAYQKGRTQKEVLKDYYQAILDVQDRFKNYSSLAHLDMIRRYDHGGEVEEAWILEQVEPILNQILVDEKALEVNTSCYRYGLKDLTPSISILKRYYDMGGRMLTLGSDAHEKRYLAHHMKEVRLILKELGFSTFCTYEKLHPVFHEL